MSFFFVAGKGKPKTLICDMAISILSWRGTDFVSLVDVYNICNDFLDIMSTALLSVNKVKWSVYMIIWLVLQVSILKCFLLYLRNVSSIFCQSSIKILASHTKIEIVFGSLFQNSSIYWLCGAIFGCDKAYKSKTLLYKKFM